MNIINTSYFDTILSSKEGKDVVRGRYDIEPIPLENKSGFVIELLESIKDIRSVTYRIQFWEQDNVIEDWLSENAENKEFSIPVLYSDTEIPGIALVNEKDIDKDFMKTLLDTHFNFELAVSPALNVEVQICINNAAEFIYLLDIYDDRGFDIYHTLK